GTHSNMNPVIHDHPKGRPVLRRCAGEISPASERYSTADGFQTINPRLRDERNMRDDPAQIRNREFGMSRLIVLDLLLEIRRSERVNLGAPACARDPLRGFHKDIVVRTGTACNEFTDSTGTYHV